MSKWTEQDINDAEKQGLYLEIDKLRDTNRKLEKLIGLSLKTVTEQQQQIRELESMLVGKVLDEMEADDKHTETCHWLNSPVYRYFEKLNSEQNQRGSVATEDDHRSEP